MRAQEFQRIGQVLRDYSGAELGENTMSVVSVKLASVLREFKLPSISHLTLALSQPDSSRLRQRVAEAVARFAPDVLAMDLCMPDIDAIDLIDELRRGGFQGRLMIVSGQPDPLREAAARLAEIRGFDVVANVRKPVDVAGLRRRLFDVANDIGGTRIALVS